VRAVHCPGGRKGWAWAAGSGQRRGGPDMGLDFQAPEAQLRMCKNNSETRCRPCGSSPALKTTYCFHTFAGAEQVADTWMVCTVSRVSL